jgi:ATP-dependent exoDNAse (exonuclease V) alpha subunit
MIKHLSLRLAWHNEGWNGNICKNPKANVYCIGQHSYPGDVIAGSRDLEWESEEGVAGCNCSKLGKIPACAYSINAFGGEQIKANANPPDFFYDDSEGIEFDLPPSTACIWPYEQMYGDDVKLPEGSKQVYDYRKRLDNAKGFFKELTNDKTLIFYYANKSNPISEDDNQVYVLVGVSRLKTTGDILYYNNVSEVNRQKYADGFVWQMPVTSHYPNEGFRIPYHKYLENEEILNKILYVPEHSNNFKFAAKHISDDDALIYIERLIQIVDELILVKDDTENWQLRKEWLQSLLSELWENRGAYPGMAPIMDFLGFSELVQYNFNQTKKGNEKKSVESIFKFLNDKTQKEIADCKVDFTTLDNYRKIWHIKNRQVARDLIEKVLCRIAIQKIQVENILKENRSENGILYSLSDILSNPYSLTEQYVGDDLGDEISFTKIDHAIIPSPQLGLDNLYPKEDWRRLRALLVDELKYETVHSFINRDTLIANINNKLKHYPDWKKEVFNEGFIEYDKAEFEKAIEFRIKDEKEFLYLREVREDERTIEEQVRELISRAEISLTKPFKESQWRNELYKSDNDLAKKAPKEYDEAIKGQTEICANIFNKPISIIAGSAGTGKTTIIKAIINAIRFTSGNAEAFCLLAPTGKAADRIREKTGETATTIHGFLTRTGWMNPNFTFKRSGGKKETDYSTIIIDESSMIDLQLMAALFRAINWNYVNRLILVGDPNQLPPIGKGKVFSDIIEFVKETNEEAYGKLKNNVRQLENKATGKGTGIIDLASLYIKENIKYEDTQGAKVEVENLLKEIQESDEDVKTDLRIVTWKDTDELEEKLVAAIKKDMEADGSNDPMKYQVISPYRGELFGTENLNTVLQKALNGFNIDRKGNIAGITVFDKVIQYINRSGRKAYYSYNMKTRQRDRVEVFNGEMGRVRIHSFDKDKYSWNNFRIRQFQVAFERKSENFIDFKSDSEVESNLELGYAISVHKAQGSEFERTYFVLPKNKQALLSTELLYTGITRAQKHLTVFVEDDFRTFISMRRPEKSRLSLINSSVFEFNPLHEELLIMRSWYEEGKIHSTLSEFMVRSKSEVIIANMLFDNGFEDVEYEQPLIAPKDGTFYLPDFTVKWRGKTFYWEHLGMLDIPKYKKHWDEKQAWYDKHFKGQLITTVESKTLSIDTKALIDKLKRNEL